MEITSGSSSFPFLGCWVTSDMRHSILMFLILLGLTACQNPNPGIRVVTYNIRHGLGMDGEWNLDRIVSVLEEMSPDLVILNEVDAGTRRSERIEEARRLGEALGLDFRFGRSIDYDGGEYGNALLSRYPILEFRVHDLSLDSLHEGRSIFQARILVFGDTLHVFGTHLGLSVEERSAQIHKILTILTLQEKTILTGDLNLESDEAAWGLLSPAYLDVSFKLGNLPGYTFPADVPQRRIDYIFTSLDLIPVEILAIPDLAETASDHLPLGARIKLRP